MLEVIYGKAVSGKTFLVNSRIKELVGSGKSGITLIIPEQDSFRCESEMLTLLGADKTDCADIVSFRRLAEKVMEKSGLKRKPLIDDNCRRVFMGMAVESVSDSLRIFSKCVSANSVDGLSDVFDGFMQSGVTPERFLEACISSGNEILIEKAKELSLIFETYTSLVSAGFSDGSDDLDICTRLIAENGYFEGRTVFVDGFSGYTEQEYRLLSVILSQAEKMSITVCTDSVTGKKDVTDPMYYTFCTARKLRSLAARADKPFTVTECRYEPSGISEGIKAVISSVYSGCSEKYDGRCDSIEVCSCASYSDEASFTAMNIKKLVREKGYRYRDFAVIQRGDTYTGYLRTAFRRYGIPFFEDNRRMLRDEPIARLADGALSAVINNFDTESILRCLKTSLYGLTADEISMLENYTVVWQTDRGDWLRPWTNHPDGFGFDMTDADREKLNVLNELRARVIFPLIRLKNALSGTSSDGCVRAVYDFLCDVHAGENLLAVSERFISAGREDLAVECERVWDEFMILLDRLARTLDDRNITAGRFYELFGVMLAGADMGDIPRGVDEITVGDAARIRTSGKKAVFIIGANENVFPAAASKGFVLTPNERRLLKKENVELYEDGEMLASKERFLVYCALSRPTEKLFVTYSMADVKGGSMLPSEFVREITDTVPDCIRTDYSLIPDIDKIESDASAFAVLASVYSQNNETKASLIKYLDSVDGYAQRTAALKRAADSSPAKIRDRHTAEKLFGKNINMSPSAMENYHKCPFKYFCLHGLNVKKLKKAEITAALHGLLVHYVLENIFRDYSGRNDELCGLSEKERAEKVSAYVKEYVEKEMNGFDGMSDRMKQSLSRIEKSVNDILDRLVFEFSSSEFVTVAVELPIGRDKAVPPYVRVLSDGGSISLQGIVDRVDTMEKDGVTYLRVVDYKTGGKDFNVADVLSGLNMQMLIYLMCLWENGRELYGDTVPAGVLYVPAKSGSSSLGRKADENTVNDEKIKQGQMNGIVLAHPAVMNGMDTTGRGILLSNKIINKNGEPGKYAFSPKQFEILFNEVNRVVEETALALHDGEIEAAPVKGTGYETVCKYCDYKAVCGHEENDGFREINKDKDWILKAGEKDG